MRAREAGLADATTIELHVAMAIAGRDVAVLTRAAAESEIANARTG